MLDSELKLEESILGNMLQSRNSVLMAMDLLTEECFYKSEHKMVFSAMAHLDDNGLEVDLVTVVDRLRKTKELKKVGLPWLSNLTNHFENEALLNQHCLLLKESKMRRMQKDFAGAILYMADEAKDVFEINEYMADQVHLIASEGILRTPIDNNDLCQTLIAYIEKAKSDEGVTGVPTGFYEIDNLFGGWQKSEFIVIGARPAMGKTALMICMAMNMAIKHDKRVLIFSQEMSASQVFFRMASIATGLEAKKFKTGDMSDSDWETFHHHINTILTDRIVIVDDCYHIHDIRTRTKQERLDKGVDCVFVDYIQITGGVGQNRDTEIGYVSRHLKMLSKEMDVPVIGLAQLNRGVEGRANKEPRLFDLRESGAIEQDADVVAFLHRPSYYGEGAPNYAQFRVEKNRNGALKIIDLEFVHAKAQFTDPKHPF